MTGASIGLPAAERDFVFAAVADGQFIRDIAKHLGITKSAISERYGKDPEWMRMRELGMEARLDDGFERIWTAGDDLNLARVAEIQLRRTEWRAEREFPHRWASRSHIEVSGTITLDLMLAAAERTIDGQSTLLSTGAAQQPDASDSHNVIERSQADDV